MQLYIFKYNYERLRRRLVNRMLECQKERIDRLQDETYLDLKEKFLKCCDVYYQKDLIENSPGFNILLEQNQEQEQVQ